MLGNLFPSLFSSGQGGSSSVDIGNKPQMLRGREREELIESSVLPSKPTTADVNAAAKLAGDLEADTVLLRELSHQKLAVQTAALANFEVRVSHSAQSMRNTRQFQQKLAKHGKNILEHNIGNQADKSNFDAYEARFNNVNVEI